MWIADACNAPRAVNLRKVMDAAVEPLTLDQAKVHLKVEDGVTDDDDLITGLITAGRQACEARLQRTLISTQYELRAAGFSGILLPRPPLLSVESVKYLDQAAAEQTLDPGVYFVDAFECPPAIHLVSGSSWPSLASGRSDAVRIAFTTGYGATPGDVPAAMTLWIKLQIAHWYRNREAANGQRLEPTPYCDALIEPYRVYQF